MHGRTVNGFGFCGHFVEVPNERCELTLRQRMALAQVHALMRRDGTAPPKSVTAEQAGK